MSIIRVEHVSKVFRRKADRRLLRDQLREIVSHRTEADGFHVLTDISLSIDEGESVALIGANGAGKSTLLALICGLAQPDRGSIEVRGQVAAMLEFASGFHYDLTGRENVMLNAAFLGLNRRQARERFPKIVEFSEIGEFIDQPLRTYSAGMTMRLGFAAAVHCDPSVVIIDEVLGVGDQAFQAKCLARIQEMRTEGRTLLCVSHSQSLIRSLCDRAIWLHEGRLVTDGPVEKVLEAYERFMSDPSALPPLATSLNA